MAWVKTIGAQGNTSPLDHKVDASANLFVFGRTEDTLCGHNAFFLSKLDVNGNELHQTILAEDTSCNQENPYSFSFCNGNRIFACGFQPNNQPTGLLYGFDANDLSLQWNRDTALFFVGCVQGFSNEEYLITGDVTPQLQRWSQSGNIEWNYDWTGQNANPFKVFRDQTDGVYFLLNTNDTVPSFMASGFALVKRDTLNNSRWSMLFNPSPGMRNLPINSVMDHSGNTYVLTSKIGPNDSIFVSKISSTGQMLWNSSFGQPSIAYDLKLDPMNNNILALVRVSSGIKIIRFDATGTLIDTSTCLTSQYVTGKPVFDVDTLGNSYVACVDPISPSSFITYFKKMNYSGGILWNYPYSTTIPLLPSHLSVQSDGSVITTLMKDYPSVSVDSIVIIKLDQPLSIQESQQSKFNISLFPNPTNGVFHFEMNDADFTKSEIEIYDVLGKSVFKSKLMNPKFDIDLSENAKGIYFYRIFNATEIVGSGKMIVE
jgi:hypothetical protein